MKKLVVLVHHEICVFFFFWLRNLIKLSHVFNQLLLPRKLTWTLKMMVRKRNFLLKWSLFRGHSFVFGGVNERLNFHPSRVMQASNRCKQRRFSALPSVDEMGAPNTHQCGHQGMGSHQVINELVGLRRCIQGLTMGSLL